MSEAAEANGEAEDAPSGLPPLAARRARQRLPGRRHHGAPILLCTEKCELSRDRRSGTECETVASRGRPGHREHRCLEAERPAELAPAAEEAR